MTRSNRGERKLVPLGLLESAWIVEVDPATLGFTVRHRRRRLTSGPFANL